MKKVLITGATGNVGKEVIRHVFDRGTQLQVIAGVRKPGDKDLKTIYPELAFRYFNFAEQASYGAALAGCDILFLVRPPEISQVDKYFRPLIEAARQAEVKHIVFLSVQGVQDNKFIPHYKIEQLIIHSGISYTFLRPAYFMQNFTTTLRAEIVEKRMVYLPAGQTRFTIIDVADIGAVAAAVLCDTEKHANKAYDLTNLEKYSFGEMTAMIASATGRPVKYVSPNLFRFFIQKRKEGLSVVYILVLIMLHYLPRFKKEPAVTTAVEEITGKPANTFLEFLERDKDVLV